MPGTGPKRAGLQFGVFELDPINGELRKRGLRLKLQDQPLQVLSALLERPGEILSRNEIQQRLWPAGTYVDYGNAINSTIRKLRDALGDSAECPRFIETLARRGYRFIAPVSISGSSVPIGKSPEPEKYSTQSICLIGREQERAQLLRLVNAAIEGNGSMVLIGGEPGIGKTHLTRAILSEAAKRGCFAMLGHCYEMEGSPPYGPFIEMLECSARVAPRDAFRDELGDAAPEIAKLMPELRRIYSDIPAALELPPEQQRRFLFNAYREFVERAAHAAPIVMAFEDLQWADESALLLVEHLAQTVSEIPMLIIGTYRDTEVDVTRPFGRALTGWIREKTATRVSLPRLSAPGVAAMLAKLSGKAPPLWLVDTVFQETDGNPFFVEEVFQYLAEQGKLLGEQGAWRLGLRADELTVPEGVRLVIGHRLTRLREETQRVLTTAAVIGRWFNLRLLEQLEGTRADSVLCALEEAERAHLVRAERVGREVGYRFVHELVRQTLAEKLSLPRRQPFHARIADAIERLYSVNLEAHASTLAHHLYHAGALADLDKTVTYLALAARLASAAAAHEQALTHIDNALSLAGAEQDHRTAELHATRAASLRSLARLTEAIESYECAIRRFLKIGDIQGAAEASFHLGYIHIWNADAVRASAVIDRVVGLLCQPSPLGYQLLLLKVLAFSAMGEMEASFAALSDAKKVQARLPEITADGFASMCEARVHFMAGQLSKAGECGRDALSRFREFGNVWGEAETFEPVAAALWMGSPGKVQALVADLLPRAQRIGHQNAVWAYKNFSAESMMARGDLEESERMMREVHEFALANSAGWKFLDHIVLGAIAHYRGNLDDALLWIRSGMEIEPLSYQSGHLSGMLFWTLAAKGDANAEAALAAARLHLPVPGRPLSLGACGCLALVMEGLGLIGRLEEAAALQSSAEYLVANGPLCVYTQHLFRTSAGIAAACAHNWTRAEEHHRIAIHQADCSPYRVSQPRARYWYAEMLLSRGMAGDQQRARQLLCEALALHESMSIKWQARKVAKRIAALS